MVASASAPLLSSSSQVPESSLALKLTVVESPSVSVPAAKQVTVVSPGLLFSQLLWSDSKVTPLGRVSVILISVTAAGPLLVTVIE